MEQVKVVVCWNCGRPARSDIVAGRWWCSWCGDEATKMHSAVKPTVFTWGARTSDVATPPSGGHAKTRCDAPLRKRSAMLARNAWVQMTAVARKPLRILTRVIFVFPMFFLFGVLFVPLDSMPMRHPFRLTGVFRPGGFVAIVDDDRSVQGFYKADVELRPVSAEARRLWSGLKVVDGDYWGSSIYGDFTYPSVDRIHMALMVPIPERSDMRSCKVDVRIKGSVVTPRSLGASAFENLTVSLDDVVTLPIASSSASGLRVAMAKCWIWWRWHLGYWFLFLLFALILALLPHLLSMFHEIGCNCEFCLNSRGKRRFR